MSHKPLGCHKSNAKHVAIVRNVEVPLGLEKKLRITRDLEGTTSAINTQRSTASSKSLPLNSARSTTSQFVPSTATSSAREQLSKKLNFPVDDQIYRGLIPVNVNDSIVHRDCPPLNKRAMHKKYLDKMKNKKRDPEPDLKDFLTEIKPFTDAYPKYTIDQRIDLKYLPELPRGNLDKIEEILKMTLDDD